MEFKRNDDVQFSDGVGWCDGIVCEISDWHGEYLILCGENSYWVSAHRVRARPAKHKAMCANCRAVVPFGDDGQPLPHTDGHTGRSCG